MIRLGLGDTAAARLAIDAALARSPRHPGGLLARALLELRRRTDPEGGAGARARFQAVLAAGGDTALARAGLAILAIRASRWELAAAEMRRSLAASRRTLRHLVAPEVLFEVLSPFALTGPPAVADSLLAEVAVQRPGWAALYEWRAMAALRAGGEACERAAEHFLTLVEFGVVHADGPERVARCRRGGGPR
jgi:hypothetical protein